MLPQGCPLSMVFIVALYVPWCRHLESLPDVKPQLYADNLWCSAERPGALFDCARFTARYVRSVGQDVSPGKCVLPSTSKSVRKAMKLWDISGVANGLDACFGMVGCLVFMALIIGTLGLLFWVIWLLFILNGALVLILLTLLVPGLLLNIGMLLMLLWRCLSILIFRLMVAGKTSLL